MKLVELLGVKKYQDKKMHELAYEVQKSGIWKQLGSGTFAQVLERQGKVYKFWIVDDAYEAFVKYVHSHTNKHLPKIGPIKTLMIGSKKLKYVELEKLDYCHSYMNIRMNSGKTDSGHSHIEKLKAKKQEMNAATFLRFIDSQVGHNLKTYEQIKVILMHDYGYILDDEDTIDLIKLFVDLAIYMHKTSPKFEFDVSTDNVMLRGDTIVITDPFYHHGVSSEK